MSAIPFPVELRAMTDKLSRVFGNLSAVQQQITELIGDKDTEALCRELGVRSAGFLFLDVHERVLRFLARMHDDPELLASTNVSRSVRTPYYWSSDRSAKYEKLIHSLFALVREWQVSEDVEWDENERDCRVEAEYLLYLPSVSACGLGTARAKEMDVHYCQVGDLWLTIFLWRMACCARDAGFGDVHLKSLDEKFFDVPIDAKACMWRGHNLLEPSLACELPALGDLGELWCGVACVGRTWRQEFAELVRDTEVDGQLRSWRWTAALAVACQLGTKVDEKGESKSFGSMLLATIPIFVRSLAPKGRGMSEVQTVNDLINLIERRARFPVLPFFLWNVIEEQPITYLVAPVWTSQQYPVKVLDSDCQHLGLALCAVDLIPELELSDLLELLPTASSAKREPSATVIASLLRVIARPLVEGSLYASAVTAARNDHKFLKKVAADTDLAFEEYVNDGAPG